MFNFKILLLTLFTQIVFANSINIDDKTDFYEVLSSSKIYIDKSKILSIADIQKEDKKFKINNKKLLSFGYSPDFNIWIKFKLQNNSNKTIHKIIEYGNPLTTHIEFYSLKNNIYTKQKEGLYFINKNRQSLNPTFNISLQPNESKIYYIKTTSYITTLIIKLNLWEDKVFYKKEMNHQLILTLFFGAMFILAIYNLFIFFFIRDISYLYYVLYAVGIIIHQSLYVGIANIYLLNQEYSIYIIKLAILVVSLPVVSLAFLTKSFLQTKQYPIWNKILNIYLILYPFIIIIIIITEQFNKLRNIIPVILLVYLILLTTYATYKKNRQASIVLFGWFAFLTASLFMYLSSLGVYNIFDTFPYYTEFALVLEALIFSIALTDRIKQLQKQKNEANMELILQKELETIKLTKLVDKKTHNLKIALEEKQLLLKELNHRVKNNMQTIVSLIRLQNKKIKDEKIKDIFITIQNRINAMSHLHELLYNQDNISYINAYDYFTLLINELKSSYANDININLSIKTDLKVEQSVYCGLIVNELITNSFKYAFKDKKGDINITLEKIDDSYLLNINDNGVGYDQDKQTSTLGLILVNTLSQEQLDGKIDIDSNNGVKVQIKWK